MMENARLRMRQEEDAERERKRSWGNIFRETWVAVGCVAIGACGGIALMHVYGGREGLKGLSQKS